MIAATFRSRFRRAACLVAAVLAAGSAGAQQRMALVHGLGSSGETWPTAEQRLVQEFGSRVAIYRPDLPSTSTYVAQGGILANNTQAWSNGAIFVGHSNGGIVSRMASRYSGNTYRGIVTVGTPHGGSALFQNVDAVGGLALSTAADMAIPITRYSNLPGGGDLQTFLVWAEAVTYTGLFSLATSFIVDQFVNLAVGDLRTEMTPGSAFNTNLNHDSTLTRENQQMPGRRFGIVSIQPQIGGYLCGLAFSQTSCAQAQYALADLYYDTYLYYQLEYQNPENPAAEQQARYYAYEWVIGSQALYNLDPRYCTLYTGIQYSCEGDGIVGRQAQMYPGLGASQLIVTNGPIHTAETSSDAVYQRMVPLFRGGGALAIP